MRVFITGVCGQLGHDMIHELEKRGHTTIGSDIETICSGSLDSYGSEKTPYIRMDITNKDEVNKTIFEVEPDVIIHCAAWTDVDGAEKRENREKVMLVNTSGTKNIAEAAKVTGAKMMYISTDYVFDGRGIRPWEPDDPCCAPINVYGQSKLGGESAVRQILNKYFIVRISWAFGRNGNNFVKTMINAGKTNEAVRVVSDQIGTPTYTKDLARLLADMIETEKFGVYHATNEGGFISWYGFCREIYKQYGLKTKILPVTTEEYGTRPARRPLNSRLDKRKLAEAGFEPLPTWQDAIGRYLKEANL